MINTTYAEEVDTIDIPVSVFVETVDYKTYANKQDIIDIEMFYQDDTLQCVYEDITPLKRRKLRDHHKIFI